MSGDLPTHITAEAAYTSVCQSPKIWWSSAGSRWRTLVCFHPFPQVVQYTVVEVTPIIVVLTQSVCVTRCRRSRCHQYRIAHYMNRLIPLRRSSFFDPCASSRRRRCASTCYIDRLTQFTPESGIFIGAVVFSCVTGGSGRTEIVPAGIGRRRRGDQPAMACPDYHGMGALSAHAGRVRRSASAASRARHSRFRGYAAANANRRGTRFNGAPIGTSAISMRQPS